MPDTAIPEPVLAAWQRVVEGWDDVARHDVLIGLVAQHNCFAWAASRYRERAGDDVADRQLQRLRQAVTATMLATATTRPSREAVPYRATIALFIVLVVLAFVGLVYAVRFHHSHPDPPPPKVNLVVPHSAVPHVVVPHVPHPVAPPRVAPRVQAPRAPAPR